MQQLGITAIINLSQKYDPAWNMPLLEDGQPDDGSPRHPSWFSRALSFAHAHMQGGKVLIHCEMGVVRSPSMAYAILRDMGHSPQEARGIVTSRIPNANLRYANDYEEWRLHH